MKHLSKSIIASLVSASFILAAPSAFAFHDKAAAKANTETETKKTAAKPVATTSNDSQTVNSEEQKATPEEISAEIELKEHHHDSDSWHFHCHDEDCDNESFEFNISDNSRDGIYLNMSGISSAGDDFSLHGDESSSSEFDLDFSYRVQLLGFFMESPGLSSRRIHGMYSLSAWGYNFYNSDDWAFALFYQARRAKIRPNKSIY